MRNKSYDKYLANTDKIKSFERILGVVLRGIIGGFYWLPPGLTSANVQLLQISKTLFTFIQLLPDIISNPLILVMINNYSWQWLALLLLQFPIIAIAQKRQNTIQVEGVNYKEAMAAALEQDFNIEKSDSAVWYVYTTPKQIKNLQAFIKIQVTKSGGAVVVKGEYNVPDIDNTFDRIENKGMKGSPVREAWQILEAFAKSFNKPLKYLSK